MDSRLILTVTDTDALGTSLRAEIVRLCISAFQDENFANLFVYFPTGRRHVLAYLSDSLIGHAVVSTRWVQPQGTRMLRTAYVDAVAITREVQGRGYGTQLMEFLKQEILDYEMGCLATKRTSFYQRTGWEVWRGAQAGHDETGTFPTPDQTGTMILRLPSTPQLDLDGLLTIERQGDRVW